MEVGAKEEKVRERERGREYVAHGEKGQEEIRQHIKLIKLLYRIQWSRG